MEQNLLDQQEFEAESEHFESPIEHISRWAKYATIAFAVAGPFLIFGLAPYNRWGICLAGYLNCLLYGFFAVYFLKKGTLNCLIPVFSILWMVTGSCFGIIYFGIFYPDGTYKTPGGSVSYFEGGFRYQFAIALFMLGYFVFMAIFLRKEKAIEQHPGMVSARIGKIALYFTVVTVSLQIMLTFLPLPLFLVLWIGRFFERYLSILFIAGVTIVVLPKISKIWFSGFLGIMLVFFTIKNSRSFALIPCLALFCGMIFFSEMKSRTKLTLALLAIIGIPGYLLVGNISRLVLGAGSNQASMGQKMAAFKDWRSALQRTDVATNFLGRMFFTAGNTIVANTPTIYQYRNFYPALYLKEFAVYMLPDQMVRRVMGISDRTRKLSIVYHTYYTGSWLLRDYGMEITETSAIGTSIIGHFWMLGGYLFLLLGGIAVAIAHGISAKIINRAWLKNPDKGVFYFAIVMYAFVFTTTIDFIQVCRSLLWGFIYAAAAYILIKPFLKNARRNIPLSNEYEEHGASEDYEDIQTEAVKEPD